MRALAGSRGRQRGFTLVEVLISILLCVVAVVGIMGLYRVQTKSSSFSRHTTEATTLAEDRLEQLRTMQGSAATGSDLGIDDQGNAGGIYNRYWTIVPQLPFVVGTVRVDVTWNEEGNTEDIRADGEW